MPLLKILGKTLCPLPPIVGSTMSTLTNFAEVMDKVVAGTLKRVLDKTFPLKEAAAAQK